MNSSTSLPTVLREFLQNADARTRNRAERTARTFAFLMVLVLVIAPGAQAGTSPQSAAARGLSFTYNPAHEITFVGTIQGAISQPAPGSPGGLHILISSGGKVVDAHLGPFVSEENQQALHAGQLVQIVGVNENVHGKNVLLARQLIFHGRLVTVRNERGFLVRNLVPHHGIHGGNLATNGGTR